MDAGQRERALEIADSSRACAGQRRRIGAEATDDRGIQARGAGVWHRAGRVLAGIRRSFVWVVDGAAVRVATLPPASRIEGLVADYQRLLVDRAADPLSMATTPGDALFAAVVAPIQPYLTAGRPIVLVPDGALHTVNFETLPVPGPPRITGSRMSYRSRAITRNAAAVGEDWTRQVERRRVSASCGKRRRRGPALPRAPFRRRGAHTNRDTLRARECHTAGGCCRDAARVFRREPGALCHPAFCRARLDEPRNAARLDGHPVGRQRGLQGTRAKWQSIHCRQTSSPSPRVGARVNGSTPVKDSSVSRGRFSARAHGAS